MIQQIEGIFSKEKIILDYCGGGIGGKLLSNPQIDGSFWRFFVSKTGFRYARNVAIESGISEITYYSFPGNVGSGIGNYNYQIDQSQEVNACYEQNVCYTSGSGSGNGNTGSGGGYVGGCGIDRSCVRDPQCGVTMSCE